MHFSLHVSTGDELSHVTPVEWTLLFTLNIIALEVDNWSSEA